MALRIFTNLSSLNAQKSLESSRLKLGGSISRIASGQRITNSSDDGAGLSISERLNSDVRTLKQGARNVNDGLALVNAAEGALGEQSSILIRLRELASQAATGTIGQTERETLNLEFRALRSELDRIANTTEFNGRKLVDGSLAAGNPSELILQVGLDSNDASRFNLNQEIDLTAVTAASLGIDDDSISSGAAALTALGALSNAIDSLIEVRGRVGAVTNRLSHSLNNLNSSIENLTSAVSTIRDADLADEVAQLTRNQILVQAGSAMIGQANLIPQSVLTLLQ
ncbi:MAG: flagellin FliC [Candidatus Nitrohelix vancouverensis]|uniref:Flagellin n=1 Tax=Candidatus Nitrohelix vancouverensis TaxID=2705534 RepID=A0A7T0C227_9BACT|nr:MAG: flagellin FliC [Candidatus Nitrohelix vancouverensis]